MKKFQTVGDSLTQGENGLPIQVTFIDTPNAYPSKLGVLLNTAFPNQGVVISNRGHGGDTIQTTLADLPGFLAADQPEAVLLLGGYNNLTGATCGFGHTIETPACDAAVEFVEDTIRDAIRLIKRTSSVRYVFVSTLTPPGPVVAGATDRRIDPSAINDLSNRIRATAATEGAVVVDAFSAFVGHESEYTSTDGLHLAPAGYQKIADLFFEKILATVPQSTASALRVR